MFKLPHFLAFLIAGSLCQSIAAAQEDLKLSPIEVQDLSADPPQAGSTAADTDQTDSQGAAANQEMIETEDSDAAAQLKTLQQQAELMADASEDPKTKRTVAQLARLRRPMEDLALADLDRPLEGYVDPLSEWPAIDNLPHQFIGASDDLDLSPISGRTTYCRRPLYFEDAPLERCGQSGGCCRTGVWTNGRSAAKFLIDTTLLPCRMVKRHPDEPVRATAR